MKTIKNKQILVGADFAGCPLKDAVVEHLKVKGWEVTDVGARAGQENSGDMYQRVGFKVGSMISEKKFERALIFCGTGMGIHIAANKCPHVQAAVCESVPAALRCVAANNCNVLAMGAYYVTSRMGIAMAEAFLEHNLGDGYEHWEGFYEYHKIGYDEIDEFDYEEYKSNGFEIRNKRKAYLAEEPEKLIW